MITTVKFAKIREGAIIPSKRDEDAGFDIFPCFDEDFILIKPNTTVKIPTGICSAFDKDYVCIMKERGSTGSKGIGQRSGVVDSGYRGEWLVPITNHTNQDMIIYKENEMPTFFDTHVNLIKIPYSKAICQAIFIPIPEIEVEEYAYDEIQAIGSKRGEDGFGSTDK